MPISTPKLTDIITEVTSKYSAPSTNVFTDVVAKCIAEGDINDFHPSFRPATLAGLDRFSHFVGFPVAISTVEADYFYSEDLSFPKTNDVSVIIEGVERGETNTSDISIGFDGTTITASYDVSFDDEAELGVGEELGLILTIRKENGSGDDIYSATDSSETHGEITVSKTVTSGEIGSAATIWVSVELVILTP